jgi:hypothetical protein
LIRSIPNLKRTLISIQWRIDYGISIYLKEKDTIVQIGQIRLSTERHPENLLMKQRSIAPQ